jgi:hypothetical protein
MLDAYLQHGILPNVFLRMDAEEIMFCHGIFANAGGQAINVRLLHDAIEERRWRHESEGHHS